MEISSVEHQEICSVLLWDDVMVQFKFVSDGPWVSKILTPRIIIQFQTYMLMYMYTDYLGKKI